MFDVKLGKLIVEKVGNDVLNFSNFYHSDEYYSKVGRSLIENTDLFIDAMNRLNVNLSIEENSKVKNVNLYDLAEVITNVATFECIEVQLKDLGKKVWNNVLYGYDEYENISRSINNANDDFFISLGRLIKDKEHILHELEDYENACIAFISDDNIAEMKKCLNVTICDYLTNYFFSIKDCQWMDKEIISDVQLGRLAWDYIYDDTDEYKDVLSKDISYILDNTELIWSNIDDNKKDLVKDYLLNLSKYSEDDDSQFSVLEEIQCAVDKVVINDLKYYYLCEGKWDKLSNLGNMIWHMAMKYDTAFDAVREKLEEDESFNLYMECIAKNISDKPCNEHRIDRYHIYGSLKNALRKKHKSNYSEWTIKDWTIDELWTFEQYDTMMEATYKMLNKHFSHLIKWDESNLIWVLIDNEEDYYLELTKKALNGDIEYEVYDSDSVEHETIDICFKDIKNFEAYQPIVIMWFDEIDGMSSRSTGKITDMISMDDEGYSCGLDIAYNGVACSGQTEIIMNNILELVNRKGYDYKLKEKEVETSTENNQSSKVITYTAHNETSINVNFDSKLEVLDMVEGKDVKEFVLSCTLPYLSFNNELKILTEIKVLYAEKQNNYIILNNNEKGLVGINEDDLINKVSSLCSTHMKNEEFIKNF